MRYILGPGRTWASVVGKAAVDCMPDTTCTWTNSNRSGTLHPVLPSLATLPVAQSQQPKGCRPWPVPHRHRPRRHQDRDRPARPRRQRIAAQRIDTPPATTPRWRHRGLVHAAELEISVAARRHRHPRRHQPGDRAGEERQLDRAQRTYVRPRHQPGARPPGPGRERCQLLCPQRGHGRRRGRPGVVFGVILGTGFGGGIVVHGRVIQGPHPITGEWGHNPLPWPHPDELPGPHCWCGHHGCLETWVAGPALARDCDGDGAHDASGIPARAAAGEAKAREALARHADRLARGLATSGEST